MDCKTGESRKVTVKEIRRRVTSRVVPSLLTVSTLTYTSNLSQRLASASEALGEGLAELDSF